MLNIREILQNYWPKPPDSDLKTYTYNELLGIARNLQEITHLKWDDLRFPSQGINPAGSTTPPTVSTTDGTLLFSGTSDNVIAGVAQMPHAWANESEIHPHLHLRFPTSASANTRWKLEYQIANVNDVFAGSYTSDIITVANPQSTQKHVIAAFSAIVMTGYKDSCCMLWRVSRLASSDAADNHTAAVSLLEFDIHYQSITGSFQEYPV